MSERRILRDVKWSSYEPGRNEYRRLTGTRYVGNAITNAARPSRFREGTDRAAESETKLDIRARKANAVPAKESGKRGGGEKCGVTSSPPSPLSSVSSTLKVSLTFIHISPRFPAFSFSPPFVNPICIISVYIIITPW